MTQVWKRNSKVHTYDNFEKSLFVINQNMKYCFAKRMEHFYMILHNYLVGIGGLKFWTRGSNSFFFRSNFRNLLAAPLLNDHGVLEKSEFAISLKFSMVLQRFSEQNPAWTHSSPTHTFAAPCNTYNFSH